MTETLEVVLCFGALVAVDVLIFTWQLNMFFKQRRMKR